MANGTPVFGLEIHLQLLTNSKAFCSCRNGHSSQPNRWVCPVCLGLPGAMAVPNAAMFDAGIKLALSLFCEINLKNRFDRKNYFYPDLPKGYQITQHYIPLAINGKLPIDEDRFLPISEIHLEEDSGRIIHDEPFVPEGKVLIDYNRAGIPLAEIVTHPVSCQIEDVIIALKKLQSLARWLKISEAEMSNGSMRVDLNVSIKGQSGRSEIKNMNSFREMKAAVDIFLEERQSSEHSSDILTRGWNHTTGTLTILRKKENLPDYRYIPDPDILPIVLSEEKIAKVKREIGLLPDDLRKMWKDKYDFDDEILSELVKDKETADYFSRLQTYDPVLAAKIILRFKPHKLGITTEKIKDLIVQLQEGHINFALTKEIIAKLQTDESNVLEIMDKYSLRLINDKKMLHEVLDVVIFEHAKQFEELRAGNIKMIKFFIGKIMAKTERRANPETVKRLIEEEIKEKS